VPACSRIIANGLDHSDVRSPSAGGGAQALRL